MKPYYEDGAVTLHHGDCLDVLAELPDASVDAVVTDPPYGLEFMGKDWDAPWKASSVGRGARVATERAREFTEKGKGHSTSTGPYLAARIDSTRVAGAPFQAWCEAWATECLRILKPGGHLLAFGGSRTWHRLTCAVEDAGFEIRDSIAWLYGSGFPKSLDVSKAIDKARNDKADTLAVTSRLADLASAAGITRADVDGHMGTSDMGGWWLSTLLHRCVIPSVENWTRLRDLIPGARELDAEVWRLNGRKGSPGEAWQTAEVIGERTTGIGTGRGHVSYIGDSEDRSIRAANSDAAQQWSGWGTALKPAFEPVVVARKPLAGTVAANVLAHGTGALNIDGCRIAHDEPAGKPSTGMHGRASGIMGRTVERHRETTSASTSGRWPANVILDESQAAALDEQSGTSTSTARTGKRTGKDTGTYGAFTGQSAVSMGHDDAGGASRFFYTAKADQAERITHNGVAHPTVKPLDLMRWLVRLVTPPGGTILEPFAGSGTTVEAAILEGFRCIAIEREADYLPLITQRINRRRDPIKYLAAAGDDLGLFADGEAS